MPSFPGLDRDAMQFWHELGSEMSMLWPDADDSGRFHASSPGWRTNG